MRDLLTDLCIILEAACVIFSDSKSAVNMSLDPVAFKQTKHILRAAEFLRDLVQRGLDLLQGCCIVRNIISITQHVPKIPGLICQPTDALLDLIMDRILLLRLIPILLKFGQHVGDARRHDRQIRIEGPEPHLQLARPALIRVLGVNRVLQLTPEQLNSLLQ